MTEDWIRFGMLVVLCYAWHIGRLRIRWLGWGCCKFPRLFTTRFLPKGTPMGAPLLREELREAKVNSVGLECGPLELRLVVHGAKK